MMRTSTLQFLRMMQLIYVADFTAADASAAGARPGRPAGPVRRRHAADAAAVYTPRTRARALRQPRLVDPAGPPGVHVVRDRPRRPQSVRRPRVQGLRARRSRSAQPFA